MPHVTCHTRRRLLPLLLALSAPVLGAGPVTYELSPATGAYARERGFGYDLGLPPAAGGRPFFFSIAVAEGNYRVTVAFGDAARATTTTVKAESRRLMLEAVAANPGETVTRSFLANVRNGALPPPPKNAPGGTSVVFNERETGSLTWDEKLTLEFDGTGGRPPGVRSVTIEPAGGPTVFIAGDSTVCDQRWEDGASWGQMLPRFLPGIVIANHAESGETLKSYLTGLRLAKVLSQIKAGDFLLIQFGHNDEKKQWPQTYVEAGTTYKAYLRVLIAEARRRGATPILVTSMQRRSFDQRGRIVNSHGGYPQAVREVAAEQGVALIDLEPMSVALYEALGPGRAPLAFANGGKDITHHNNYGAYELAKCVVQGIRDAKLPLMPFIAPDFVDFDPARPDDPATCGVPASPLHSDMPPRGN